MPVKFCTYCAAIAMGLAAYTGLVWTWNHFLQLMVQVAQ